MNPEIIKYGAGLISIAIASYTIVKVSDQGNSVKFESGLGKFELGRQVSEGNEKILTEMRHLDNKVSDLRSDIDKRMDILMTANVRTSKELKYLRLN